MVANADFSPQAQAVAQRVFEIVAEFRHSPIDNEHILLALLESSDETITGILTRMGVNIQKAALELRVALRYLPPSASFDAKQLAITQRVKSAIEQAQVESWRMSAKEISTEHILLALVSAYYPRDDRHVAVGIRALLEKAGITPDAVRKALREIQN